MTVPSLPNLPRGRLVSGSRRRAVRAQHGGERRPLLGDRPVPCRRGMHLQLILHGRAWPNSAPTWSSPRALATPTSPYAVPASPQARHSPGRILKRRAWSSLRELPGEQIAAGGGGPLRRLGDGERNYGQRGTTLTDGTGGIARPPSDEGGAHGAAGATSPSRGKTWTRDPAVIHVAPSAWTPARAAVTTPARRSARSLKHLERLTLLRKREKSGDGVEGPRLPRPIGRATGCGAACATGETQPSRCCAGHSLADLLTRTSQGGLDAEPSATRPVPPSRATG